MHVDDWVERFDGDRYAQWCLFLFRLPAVMKMNFHDYIKDYKLYCTYKDVRYRVTGASRLGDVWLAKDMNRDMGYDHRVDVTECSEWSNKP